MRIFRTPADCQAYLDILLEAARQFRVTRIAFSLMPNHRHLVLAAGLDNPTPFDCPLVTAFGRIGQAGRVARLATGEGPQA